MSTDGIAEQEAILTRLKTLFGGRWYDGVPEETILERYPSNEGGGIKPYGIVTFGGFIPLETDRSITGEEDQPQIMPVIMESWAGDAKTARRSAGAVRTKMLGFIPSAENSSQMRFRGGTPFEQKDASGRPVRWMESVVMNTVLNLSVVQP